MLKLPAMADGKKALVGGPVYEQITAALEGVVASCEIVPVIGLLGEIVVRT